MAIFRNITDENCKSSGFQVYSDKEFSPISALLFRSTLLLFRLLALLSQNCTELLKCIEALFSRNRKTRISTIILTK